MWKALHETAVLIIILRQDLPLAEEENTGATFA